MSNQQSSRPAGPQRPGPAPQAPQGGGVVFDPLKLLQKYKFVLVGAMALGLIIGIGSHFLFLRFAPGFKSTVLLKCSPVETETFAINVSNIDEDEMARFMGTQVQIIKGETVINAVLADSRLEFEAPKWYKQYSRNGRLDIIEATKELEKIIKAYSIPKTYLIQMSVQVGDRNDAAGLLRLIKENYIRLLGSDTSSGITKRKEAIRKSISESEAVLIELNARKNRLVEVNRLGTTTADKSAEAEMLQLVNAQIINNQQLIEAHQVRLANDEAQLQRNTPIQYDPTLRDRVESHPIILSMLQRIGDLKTSLTSLQAAGIQPEHRTYKLTIQQLEATERELAETRERLLLESFNTRVDSTRTALGQLQAQIADLTSTQEELLNKLNKLTQTTEEINEINRQIENTLNLRSEQDSQLAQLSVAARLDSADRITVTKSENIPDRPAFPVIYIMVPLGIILVTGLTAGAIAAFEILDQRIKSAADIAMIPRTPILGIIPDAEEDPSAHGSLQTLFMDSPNSVLAEHYRQLRTKITKKMGASGHRTLLVAGAMPRSGATSVATNLAQACEAAGKKTLLIDTNFRRAKIHTAFGLQDNPGLAEVLAGEKTLTECIQKTTDKGPDVLAAGARNLRVVERLGTELLGKVLAESSTSYDVVILDVAPAIVAGDALTLASQVDATMLVVRAMAEKRGQVARLKNELSDHRSEFLGVLVNCVQGTAGGYMRRNIQTSHKYHAGDPEHAA